jgi:selenide,water dikinase
MKQLNRIGTDLAKQDSVHAITDVTGFGLLGHLIEMCHASQCSASVEFERVPLIDPAMLRHYLERDCIPGGTRRNLESYGQHVTGLQGDQELLLADPQTSGGLLISVGPEKAGALEALLRGHDLPVFHFGTMLPASEEATVFVKHHAP